MSMPLIQGMYNGSGWSIAPTTTDPIKTPNGLLATRAIETKAGWIGQVIVDKEILWESESFDDKDAEKNAIAAASQRVIQALRTLLA